MSYRGGMNKNLAEIAFILDRSGSMDSVADAAIEGFNHFLRDQQDAPGLARLTLVLFDDEYLVPVRSLPVAEVVPLDRETYVPRNTTALLDAIGRTIDELGNRLSQTPEAERPGTVVVAILTDGLENASTRYSWQDISKRIRHQTDFYKWQFLFLGANQDAIATAAQISISAQNSATYAADAIGTRSSHRSTSRKVRGLRAKAAGVATISESADAEASLERLVSEEDNEERGR